MYKKNLALVFGFFSLYQSSNIMASENQESNERINFFVKRFKTSPETIEEKTNILIYIFAAENAHGFLKKIEVLNRNSEKTLSDIKDKEEKFIEQTITNLSPIVKQKLQEISQGWREWYKNEIMKTDIEKVLKETLEKSICRYKKLIAEDIKPSNTKIDFIKYLNSSAETISEKLNILIDIHAEKIITIFVSKLNESNSNSERILENITKFDEIIKQEINDQIPLIKEDLREISKNWCDEYKNEIMNASIEKLLKHSITEKINEYIFYLKQDIEESKSQIFSYAAAAA